MDEIDSSGTMNNLISMINSRMVELELPFTSAKEVLLVESDLAKSFREHLIEGKLVIIYKCEDKIGLEAR